MALLCAVLSVWWVSTVVHVDAQAVDDGYVGTTTYSDDAIVCGVIPVINTELTDVDLAEISAFLERLQEQGLYTTVVRLDLAVVTAAKPLNGVDESIVVASNPTATVPSQRERLLNVGVEQLPKTCEYVVMFEDPTIQFLNENWVADTLAQLNNYEVVQPFSFVYNRRQGDGIFNDVDFEGDMLFATTMGREPGQLFYSAAYGYNLLRNFDMHRGVAVEKLKGYGGGVWAFHRSFLETTGGVYDRALYRGPLRSALLCFVTD